jgi:hypothetical protein
MTLPVLTQAIAIAGCLAATIQGRAQVVSLSVVQQYAPTIYLNAYEKNMPSSVDNFFAQSKLMNSSGAVIANPVTYAALAANPSASNYLTPSNGVFPSVQSGLALDGGANSSGTHPQMWTSNGTVDQQWVFQASGSGDSITSVQSGLVLDGGTNTKGANPQMYSSNGTVDQQWILTLIP